MNQNEALEILQSVGAIISGHFVLTSGRHSDTYVNKDAAYPDTEKINLLCQAIAQQFSADEVEVVMAPAIGGVILTQWVANWLSIITDKKVLAVYAEKADPTGTTFVIKRGYDQLIAGKNVLVVEDILTTGGSVKKVVEATRMVGGKVIGVGALVNRGDVTEEDVGNVPKLTVLLEMFLDTHDAQACPLCEAKVPVDTEFGKGREFLSQRQPV